MASNTDWETIEREYRAGQLSVREIARRHEISEKAIRKRAERDGWQRDLADKVRQGVREALVRSDGSADSPQGSRAQDDAAIQATAIAVGQAVVTSHRRDLQQLHGLKRVLADRLSTVLHGGEPDGPVLGERESPGDLLEKLARISARLIPLERQAHNLDDPGGDEPATKNDVRTALARLDASQRNSLRGIAEALAGGPGGAPAGA